MILDGTETSLNESIKELNLFEKISGLKINLSKSQVIWIGNKKYSDTIFHPEWKLRWGDKAFTLLGIDFHVDLHMIPKLNYDKKLVKIKGLINTWKNRPLTPIGRITVIKSLLSSQLNHLFMALPNPSQNFLRQLNTELYHFLWNSKIDKVRRDVIVQHYLNGGLKMINIKAYMDSLKLTWIRRLYNTNSKWQHILKTYINIDMLSNCGSEYISVCTREIKNEFWKNVFAAWHALMNKINNRDSKVKNILKIPIWYNNLFQVDNSSVFYNEWYKKGVIIINDIIKDKKTCTFLGIEDLNTRYQIKTNFLQYYGIINAIKHSLSIDDIIQEENTCDYPFIPTQLEIFFKNKNGIKDFYEILNKIQTPSSGKELWNSIFHLDDETWERIYSLPFKTTKNTKFQWLQYRINQHILTTNSYLFKCGIVNSPLCDRCKIEVETIEHLIWECIEVQNFLFNLEQFLDAMRIPFSFNKTTFIFGLYNSRGICATNKTDNLILLIIKQFIYSTRCLNKTLSVQGLLRNIQNAYETHSYIVNMKGEWAKNAFENE